MNTAGDAEVFSVHLNYEQWGVMLCCTLCAVVLFERWIAVHTVYGNLGRIIYYQRRLWVWVIV